MVVINCQFENMLMEFHVVYENYITTCNECTKRQLSIIDNRERFKDDS